jgi:hypothetical protein
MLPVAAWVDVELLGKLPVRPVPSPVLRPVPDEAPPPEARVAWAAASSCGLLQAPSARAASNTPAKSQPIDWYNL